MWASACCESCLSWSLPEPLLLSPCFGNHSSHPPRDNVLNCKEEKGTQANVREKQTFGTISGNLWNLKKLWKIEQGKGTGTKRQGSRSPRRRQLVLLENLTGHATPTIRSVMSQWWHICDISTNNCHLSFCHHSMCTYWKTTWLTECKKKTGHFQCSKWKITLYFFKFYPLEIHQRKNEFWGWADIGSTTELNEGVCYTWNWHI
jgi:hypothetical protein